MDDRRKRAYRDLLYWAMLDIRTIQWSAGRGWRAWSPSHRRWQARRVCWAGALADWLHNLALYSAHDFEWFDEGWFWRDYELVRSRYPEFGMERYRERFDRQVSAAEAGG